MHHEPMPWTGFLFLCVSLTASQCVWGQAIKCGEGTARDHEVLRAMNDVRQNPSAYADSLKKLISMYEGSRRKVGPNSYLITQEGRPAVEEAIRDLRNTKPLPAFKWNACLQQSALDHVKDTGPKGSYGHTGSSGLTFGRRIRRYSSRFRTAGENISYGSEKAADVVRELIIDDGVPGRGHRHNILSRSFSESGVACGPHSEMQTMCVIDFLGR